MNSSVFSAIGHLAASTRIAPFVRTGEYNILTVPVELAD